MAERTVIISRAEVRNSSTGQVTTSQVYHLVGGCSSAPSVESPHYFEVPEDVAVAFGRRLCLPCITAQERAARREQVSAALQRVDLSALTSEMPGSFEVRVLYHDPERSYPMVVWSSMESE